ncbi:MAG: hypothetical protein GXY52_11355 [Chloroflexi bacterium]|nr:hypothetical protein [Chloroflexota bacterium]
MTRYRATLIGGAIAGAALGALLGFAVAKKVAAPQELSGAGANRLAVNPNHLLQLAISLVNVGRQVYQVLR